MGLINSYQIFTDKMSRLGAYESEIWLFQTFFEPRKAKIDKIVLPPCVQTAISRKPFELQSWDWSQCFQNLILHPIWVFWEFTTIKFEHKTGPHYRNGVKNV